MITTSDIHTANQRQEMFEHCTSIQAERIKDLERKGWIVIDYYSLLGLVSMTDRTGYRLKTIDRKGHEEKKQ
jgi:hypothetical protein